MSSIEHLIENALTATSKSMDNAHQAFVEEMSAMHNRLMLQDVSITMEELWEIVQYIIYTWLPTMEQEN